MQRLITLATDFGLSDGYAGVVKGAIYSINPHVTVVDLSHEIAAYDLAAADWITMVSHKYFPPESIHVVVVDPGVGSSRRPLAIETSAGIFIGPDNGIFSSIYLIYPESKAYELTDKQYWLPSVSATFHARDLFAPVAAHVACGVLPEQLGRPVDSNSLIRLPEKKLTQTDSHISGQVVYIDKFGNLVTNIPAHLVDGQHAQYGTCTVGGKPVGKLGACYASLPPGGAALVAGSHGFLEISVKEGRAVDALQASRGQPVIFRY